MSSLLNSLYFPSKYLCFSHGAYQVVLNADNCRSRKFLKDEYAYFNKLLLLKQDSTRGAAVQWAAEMPDAIAFVKQMIVSGMVSMKPFIENKHNEVHGKPLAAYWGVSLTCNFRCRYCYADCGAPVKETPQTYLTPQENQRVIDKIADHGFREITFTGGEPLLNKDLFDMAAYAKKKGLLVGLLSNGSLIRNHAVEKFETFDYVKLSLDSMREEENDYLRGRGSYHLIVDAIEHLRSHNIDTHIGTVLTRVNKDSIKELINELYTTYNIKRHTIANFSPLGNGAACADNLECTPEETRKNDALILETKLKLSKRDVHSVLNDNALPEGRQVCCGMGISEIFINERGDVYPCRMTYSNEYYLGNILTCSMSTIQKNVERITNDLTVDSIESCKVCNYKYVCGGGCRMYHCAYTGSIYKSHPPLCDTLKWQLESLLLLKHGVYNNG
ncbi:MAG: radical SAM protein [Treponema sp.]|nr:radical SAM protein [Treponema sp.]